MRKLIGRHPECLPLISRKAGAPVSRTVDRLLTSSGALSGTTGLKNRPLAPGGGDDAAAGGGAASGPGGEGGGGGCVDEYDPESKDSKGAGAMNTSLWELAALQNHYHPAVATLVRGLGFFGRHNGTVLLCLMGSGDCQQTTVGDFAREQKVDIRGGCGLGWLAADESRWLDTENRRKGPKA